MGRSKYVVSKFRFILKKFLKKQSYIFDGNVQGIVQTVSENGFAVVPNFYSEEECRLLRDEIDSLIVKREKENKLWVDSNDADKRCFAAEDDNEVIARYCYNKFLNAVADNYFGAKMTCSNTMAGRIIHSEGNIGSGQGWHRDGNQMQFKALIYLSDVELKDGPFQIIRVSHKLRNILKHINLMGYNGVTTRFTLQQIKKVINYKPDEHKVLTGKAGTVVFFDSSAIHTGSPLTEGGERYALTNYYMPSYEDIRAQRDVFRNGHKKV